MPAPIDIQERGAIRKGRQLTASERLFMQLLAFGECPNPAALTGALAAGEFESVLYADIHDPRGIALLTWNRNPDFFINKLRPFLLEPPFAGLRLKPEFSMFGRTYSAGHEPDLESWLFERPRRTVLNPEWPWAVWYPLRRSGSFSSLPPQDQAPILAEHGKIGHAFGEAGYAHDIRLACFGMDPHDNDFIIGLIGSALHPLSACIQAMRKTQQTSRYVESMGPFLVGRAIWQSAVDPK